MPAQRLRLIVPEADEDSSMAGPRSGPVLDFIENELEAEETHLEDTVIGVPIQREAELLRIEAP
jgi:hypothetical protein